MEPAKLWIEVIAAITIPLAIILVVCHRMYTKKGMGV